MNILLTVCGSISAYKSYDLVRSLLKKNHNVKVVLTKGARKFINSETFVYLGAEKVFECEDDFNINKKEMGRVIHIDLVKWCDRIIIAPASANTLAKMANGICDDLATSIFLANAKKTTIIFPAMNTQMLHHPMTQSNLKKMIELDHVFIHPSAQGELACGDHGEGKLPSPELICEFSTVFTPYDDKKPKRSILITAGATVSPLDPVRYLANPASGKTGLELAKFFLSRGDHVVLIVGYQYDKAVDDLKELPNLKIIYAPTTSSMHESVMALIENVDIYISSAAIADIEFKVSHAKLRKKDFTYKLEFTHAKDILSDVLKLKREGLITVGFAALSELNRNDCIDKWKTKPVELLIANQVHNGIASDREAQGFAKNENRYMFVKNGDVIFDGELEKAKLAEMIDSHLKGLS